MIRKFFADTRDMILDALAAIGLMRGGATWARQRRMRRAERAAAEAEATRRAASAQYRMCPECRLLVPVREARCPDCGTSMSRVPRPGLGRALAGLVPSFGSVSTTLLGAMVLIYAVTVLLSAGRGGFLSPWRGVLGAFGAKFTPLVLQGEWWRLVNPIFLHGSLLHIGFNGYALANLGPALEAAIGRRRFFVVFVGCGVASFVASTFLSPRSLSIGASGALFGLIGFGVVHGRMRGGTLFRAFSDDLLRWALFGLVMSFIPGIDWAAHVGGLISGCVAGRFVGLSPRTSLARERFWTVATVICAILPLAGFACALLS